MSVDVNVKKIQKETDASGKSTAVKVDSQKITLNRQQRRHMARRIRESETNSKGKKRNR